VIPRLTTVRQDVAEIGRQGVSLLKAMIEGQPVEDPQRAGRRVDARSKWLNPSRPT
jgi:DNA-binding LacI/PurR family transcriptional regulator